MFNSKLQEGLLEILTLNPETIDFSDKETVKQLFIKLLNIIEYLLQKDKQQTEKIKALEDEINRLKGEKGRPKIKPSVPLKENSAPKTKPKEWKKNNKNERIKIDRREQRRIDRTTLPPDAQFKGYRSVIIQDVIFKPNNTEYLLERFYSKSEGKLYEAQLPEDVRGSEFGNELKALIHHLYFKERVTEPKVHELLRDIGIFISRGEISNILTKDKASVFTQEKQEIFEEGMEHADYFNIDDTGARHMGENHRTHGICAGLFTAFFNRPRKDKETIRNILNLSGTDWWNKIMISDDARQFWNLTLIQALCWIHEIRHYRKLNPLLDYHRDILHNFLAEIWEYYFILVDYKESPDRWNKEFLEKWFDKIFSRETGYAELDQRITSTMGNKDRLLAVLDHPNIPLHNNDVEIVVREPVIKRNISYGTRSEAGKIAWENMLSISDTCRKLDVSFFGYLNDRFSGKNEIPKLATLIGQKAAS